MSPVSSTKKDLKIWKKLEPKIRFPAQLTDLVTELDFSTRYLLLNQLEHVFKTFI
jgi:hypothetical protein